MYLETTMCFVFMSLARGHAAALVHGAHENSYTVCMLLLCACRVNNMERLSELRKFATDKGFQAKWAAVKRQKKAKLAELIKKV